MVFGMRQDIEALREELREARSWHVRVLKDRLRISAGQARMEEMRTLIAAIEHRVDKLPDHADRDRTLV
jgi:hypothetical protein